MKSVENYSTVAFINARKNVIQEVVESAIKLHSFKRRVLAENMISKCLQETHSSEKVARTPSLFAECHVAKNCNAVTPALEAVTKGHAKTAK